MARQPLVDQDLLIVEASGSHWTHTLGRTLLEGCSARRRGVYLTKHTTNKRQKSMGLEPTIPASKRPETHALDRAPPRIATVL